MTLEAASGKASIDITHWQKVEAGSVNVSMVTLVRLADGLDVNLVDLFAAGPPGKRAAR